MKADVGGIMTPGTELKKKTFFCMLIMVPLAYFYHYFSRDTVPSRKIYNYFLITPPRLAAQVLYNTVFSF